MIGDASFGLDIDFDVFINETLKTLPRLSSIDGRLVMQDLYEAKYGIYNHLDPNNTKLLSSVAMHACEDTTENSILEEIIRSYMVKNIKDLYGLSLIEFLDLPMDIIDLLFKIGNEDIARKDETLKQLEKSFKT